MGEPGADIKTATGGVSADGGTPTDAPPVEVGVYGVTKRFGRAVAVHGVTLEVRKGEFFSFLGPSGCGKTTTLRMIAGFEDPDEGRVVLSGTDTAGVPPYRRNVNTVFQSYALFPHLSVADNVAFGLKRKKIPKHEIDERVRRYLDLVELRGMDDRRPGQLSGGQQQRVALARALVNEPAVLLLDEPLGALDLKLRKQMQLELMRIQREVGVTFVYVTHDQEEALVMSDRLVVMSEGRIEQIGIPEDVYERPATRFVAGFIGTSNLFDAEVLGHDSGTLVLRGAPDDRLVVRAPDGTAPRVGQVLTVTVRPEKLRLLAGSEQAAPDSCVVGGTVVDIVYQGVSTQYVIRTDFGTDLVVFRQNSETVNAVGRPGTRTRLTWSPDHNVVVGTGNGPVDVQPPATSTQQELVP